MVLRTRQQQKTVEAGLCAKVGGEWTTLRETVATFEEGLKVLAKKYTGTIKTATLKVIAKKTPVAGDELKGLATAALLEAFGGTVSPELAKQVQAVATRLGQGQRKVEKLAKPKSAPSKVGPPTSLTRTVAGEPAWLSKQRATVAEKWPPLKVEAAWKTHGLVIALVALGRDDEAHELARALIAAIEVKSAKYVELRLIAAQALAAIAWGSPPARQQLLALERWEVPDRESTELELLTLPVVALNSCHHPKTALATGVDGLTKALGRALAKHALASTPPSSGWYQAKPLAPRIEAALATLGARLKSKSALPPPAGWQPRAHTFGGEHALDFVIDPAQAKVEKRACQACGKAVRAALCAGCQTWFVAAKGAPVLCAPHQGVEGALTISEVERAMAKGRACPHCKERFTSLQ